MPLLSRKQVTVDALASELSESQAERDRVIAAAHESHESTRSSVIERGAQKAAELRRLEAEARSEAQRVEALVKEAKSN